MNDLTIENHFFVQNIIGNQSLKCTMLHPCEPHLAPCQPVVSKRSMLCNSIWLYLGQVSPPGLQSWNVCHVDFCWNCNKPFLNLESWILYSHVQHFCAEIICRVVCTEKVLFAPRKIAFPFLHHIMNSSFGLSYSWIPFLELWVLVMSQAVKSWGAVTYIWRTWGTHCNIKLCYTEGSFFDWPIVDRSLFPTRPFTKVGYFCGISGGRVGR